MAHIPDGLLSLPVLAGGAAVAAVGVAIGLRRIDDTMIIRAAVLAAMFFVLSLIAIPVGPSSIHLLLGGLMGLTLGLAAFPAVLVGLALQALFFGFGGLTVLGVNTLNIALPAVLAGLLLGPLARASDDRVAMAAGAAAAALAVAGTAACVGLSLAISASEFVPSARILVATYLPLMVIEAIVTAFIVAFLRRVRPDILGGALPARMAGP